jgi:tetratricopeptide (TPR) repeat protein
MSELAPTEKALWSAAAARALEAALSREPAQDRGHWTSLAHLHAESGDLAAAARVLEEASRLYPEEMTWPYSLAGLLLEAGQAEAALPWAERALDRSYGDNRLRSAERLARVELALGHAPRALSVIEAALSGQPAPPQGLEVRTHRYVNSLQALRAEVQRAAETKK